LIDIQGWGTGGMNGDGKGAAMMGGKNDGQSLYKERTTVGLKITTKEKLDRNKAPGQCYDGFICQLVSLWEQINGNKK